MKQTQEDTGWTFDRKISVGSLLSVLGLILSLIFWGGKIDSRVTVIESQLNTRTEYLRNQSAEQQRSDERQDVRHREDYSLMRSELTVINGKIDRLLETRANEKRPN